MAHRLHLYVDTLVFSNVGEATPKSPIRPRIPGLNRRASRPRQQVACQAAKRRPAVWFINAAGMMFAYESICMCILYNIYLYIHMYTI